MRYQSEQGFTHPVLSPGSDHYPDGQFTTNLHKPDVVDGAIRIVIDFQLAEPVLEQLLQEGKARCMAMVYCRATMHQQTLFAHERATRIEGTIDADLLRDAVEIHPLVVAAENLELETGTADVFYQGTQPVLSEGEPLATDRAWHFSVDIDSLPLGSIFQFIPVATLTGPMKIEADPDRTFLDIRVGASQFQQMNITRQQGLTIPSVFSAALVRAIHVIQNLPPEYTPIVPGWVDTMKKQAEKCGISLNEPESDTFEIAQILLDDPFKSLMQFQMQNAEE